jgi:hypothetical protein
MAGLLQFRPLHFVQFAEVFPLGHALGGIETLSALAAPVRAKRQEKQDPKFQNPSALRAMHVVAAAHRTISNFGVHEQSKGAFHWLRMIPSGEPGRNHWTCPGN